MQASTRRARAHARPAGVNVRDTIVVIGLLALLFTAAATTGRHAGDEPRRIAAIRVAEGETLWDIAEHVDLPGLSTAEKVTEIQRLNDLSGATIAAGALIRVPASGTFQDAVAMR